MVLRQGFLSELEVDVSFTAASDTEEEFGRGFDVVEGREGEELGGVKFDNSGGGLGRRFFC